jgi:Arc/MetJ-type ribon-helix-helix transcriptional regulator
MPTQKSTTTAPKQDQAGKEKIQKLRELFADASEVGKKALENVLKELTRRFRNLRRQSKAPAGSAHVSAKGPS